MSQHADNSDIATKVAYQVASSIQATPDTSTSGSRHVLQDIETEQPWLTSDAALCEFTAAIPSSWQRVSGQLTSEFDVSVSRSADRKDVVVTITPRV